MDGSTNALDARGVSGIQALTLLSTSWWWCCQRWNSKEEESLEVHVSVLNANPPISWHMSERLHQENFVEWLEHGHIQENVTDGLLLIVCHGTLCKSHALTTKYRYNQLVKSQDRKVCWIMAIDQGRTQIHRLSGLSKVSSVDRHDNDEHIDSRAWCSSLLGIKKTTPSNPGILV